LFPGFKGFVFYAVTYILLDQVGAVLRTKLS
jgi:hypothetical protein